MKASRRHSASSFMNMPMPMLPAPPVVDGRYTHTTASLDSINNEPTTRSVDRVRTHAELEAARTRTPALAEGVSMRMAMTNHCVNDQFPYSTDEHGKQR